MGQRFSDIFPTTISESGSYRVIIADQQYQQYHRQVPASGPIFQWQGIGPARTWRRAATGPDDLINHPDDLINRSDDLIIRPDELISRAHHVRSGAVYFPLVLSSPSFPFLRDNEKLTVIGCCISWIP